MGAKSMCSDPPCISATEAYICGQMQADTEDPNRQFLSMWMLYQAKVLGINGRSDFLW